MSDRLTNNQKGAIRTLVLREICESLFLEEYACNAGDEGGERLYEMIDEILESVLDSL